MLGLACFWVLGLDKLVNSFRLGTLGFVSLVHFFPCHIAAHQLPYAISDTFKVFSIIYTVFFFCHSWVWHVLNSFMKEFYEVPKNGVYGSLQIDPYWVSEGMMILSAAGLEELLPRSVLHLVSMWSNVWLPTVNMMPPSIENISVREMSEVRGWTSPLPSLSWWTLM